MTNKEWNELSSQTVPFWMSIGDRKGKNSTITFYDKKKVISDNEILLNKKIRLVYDGVEWRCQIYFESSVSTSEKMFKEDEFTSVPTYSKSIDNSIMKGIIKTVFEGMNTGNGSLFGRF